MGGLSSPTGSAVAIRLVASRNRSWVWFLGQKFIVYSQLAPDTGRGQRWNEWMKSKPGEQKRHEQKAEAAWRGRIHQHHQYDQDADPPEGAFWLNVRWSWWSYEVFGDLHSIFTRNNNSSLKKWNNSRRNHVRSRSEMADTGVSPCPHLISTCLSK